MPPRRRHRRVRRRRVVRRSRRSMPRTGVVSRVVGFPEIFQTHLRYQQSFTSVATAALQAFRGNSVFDPDFTGGGNQPNYFDNLAALYGRYRVFSSSIKVTIINSSTTVPLRWALFPSDLSTGGTNVANASGNPYCKTGVVSQITGSRSVVTVKSSCSTAKINGKTKSQIMGSDSYQAIVSANPGDEWFWVFQIEDLSLASAMSVAVDFVITYNVRFSDKVNVNLS